MSNITLTRTGLEGNEFNGQHVWPLNITATLPAGSVLPSAKLFVYHASMSDDIYEGDLFECVASVQQMNDIPDDTPAVEDGEYTVPYYRSNMLNFHCRSPEEVDILWEDIQEDVTDLVNNYTSAATLSNIEVVTI